jgi:hypothetical protein
MPEAFQIGTEVQRTLAEVEKIRAERARLPYVHPDLKRPPQENAP